MVIILATPVVQLTNVNPALRMPDTHPNNPNLNTTPSHNPFSMHNPFTMHNHSLSLGPSTLLTLPHFALIFFDKHFENPFQTLTRLHSCSWADMDKKLEACTSDSSEIPQNYNKTRPDHKTKDNKCNTRIIEENHTYQVNRAYEITNAN